MLLAAVAAYGLNQCGEAPLPVFELYLPSAKVAPGAGPLNY